MVSFDELLYFAGVQFLLDSLFSGGAFIFALFPAFFYFDFLRLFRTRGGVLEYQTLYAAGTSAAQAQAPGSARIFLRLFSGFIHVIIIFDVFKSYLQE